MPILQQNELRKGRSLWLYRGIIVFLVVLIPIQLLPHLWMFFGMFKGPTEVIKLPPSLLPEKFLFENISTTFKKLNVWRNVWNTVILCGGTILVQIPISSLGAFALSKLRLRGSNILLLFFIGTMMISQQATIIPLYLMMFDFPLTHWNLINSFWSLILAFSAWGWAVFLFKNFFDSLPSSLFDAAKIDGANNLMIFIRIVVPLSGPVFSIAILNTFNAVYNQFMVPLMMLPAQDKWPLMVQIYAVQHAGATPWNQVMVLLAITTIPLLVIYILCQRYIVEGIVMTGIKG
ncbi:MAG: carbohydrate ABC transporter permease [Treponema sp.]|jgi:multiple sugar transport system permease protein|nr:carbohydrate ABC transporter permease [Treponema sp.]